MAAGDLLRFVVGLALLLAGAEILVRGASRIAAALRIPPLVIGLTVVAFGTSSPELAASLASTRAGSADLALGNVVGSNIFNVLAVLGISAAESAGGVAVPLQALRFDLPIALAASVVCLPIFFTRFDIDRWEGGLYLLV